MKPFLCPFATENDHPWHPRCCCIDSYDGDETWWDIHKIDSFPKQLSWAASAGKEFQRIAGNVWGNVPPRRCFGRAPMHVLGLPDASLRNSWQFLCEEGTKRCQRCKRRCKRTTRNSTVSEAVLRTIPARSSPVTGEDRSLVTRPSGWRFQGRFMGCCCKLFFKTCENSKLVWKYLQCSFCSSQRC